MKITKVFSGYEITQTRGGYKIVRVNSENDEVNGVGNVPVELFRDVNLDKAFNEENINPFISTIQARSRTTVGKNMRLHMDESIKKVKKKLKIKGFSNKHVTARDIKKMIRRENDKRVMERKEEVFNDLKKIEENKDSIISKYENSTENINGNEKTIKLNDGTEFVFDQMMYNSDVLVGIFKDRKLENYEMWELYGKIKTSEEE